MRWSPFSYIRAGHPQYGRLWVLLAERLQVLAHGPHGPPGAVIQTVNGWLLWLKLFSGTEKCQCINKILFSVWLKRGYYHYPTCSISFIKKPHHWPPVKPMHSRRPFGAYSFAFLVLAKFRAGKTFSSFFPHFIFFFSYFSFIFLKHMQFSHFACNFIWNFYCICHIFTLFDLHHPPFFAKKNIYINRDF